jgi:O-acetylhomoserine (thiol)-lyase
MMMFRVNGSQADAASLLEKVHLFGFMVNVGDAKSLITHPATSTHFGQPKEVLEGAGIYPDSIRLSIGIEDKEDLIADLKQALDTLV